MVIRHAEKPDDAGTISGIDVNGNQNREELTVRGWQRAGALARIIHEDRRLPRISLKILAFWGVIGTNPVGVG